MALLLQFVIAGVWASTLIIHTRRLFRLACVAQLSRWDNRRVKMGLSRLWWWLGKDEFWTDVRTDSFKAIQITLMIFLIAWGQTL